MSFSLIQQFHQLVQDKKHILITFKKDGSGDAIGSALAMKLLLEALGKRVDIVVDGFSLPAQYNFLTAKDTIKPALGHLKKSILSIDIKENGLAELQYDVKDGQLRIFMTPQHGTIKKEQIQLDSTAFVYDLILVLDTEDFASLGSVYSNNPDFFYGTPVVNIDTHVGNEHFGHINIVDITKTTTGELVFDMFAKIGDEYIQPPVATALLTAIIAKTRSFKSDNTSPHTLVAASRLIAYGAERERIVEQLFQTKTVSILKLWGEVLSRLEYDPTLHLATSVITKSDLVRFGATPQDLYGIIEEIIGNSPDAELILLIYEDPSPTKNDVHAILHTNKNHNAIELLATYNVRGSVKTAMSVLPNTTITDAKQLLHKQIAERLKK